MNHSTVLSQLEIPPVIFLIETKFFDFFLQHFETLFSLASSDNLLDTIVDFLEHGPLPVHLTQQELVATVQSLVKQGQEYVQFNAPSLAGEVLSNAGSIVDVFVVLALALFMIEIGRASCRERV